MQLEIEKRSAPRVDTNVAIDLFPNNMRVNIVNLSETGICFEGEGPILLDNTTLSMTLFSHEKPTEISARVVHHAPVGQNKIRYGAQFLLSDQRCVAHLRDVIFDNFAKRATAAISDTSEDLKTAVEDFFKIDMRQYYQSLLAMAHGAENQKIKPQEIEKELKNLTDKILIKANELERKITDKKCVKMIKQIFREIAGCWFYKSPIVKMAYDRPRGYPGDYLLFETIYDNKPLAEKGSIGYYCDNYFLNNVYAQAARCRKNKMKNILQDLIENTEAASIKLLNVACGPSREIRELLSDPCLAARKNLIFTGLDNDEEALKFTQSKLNKLPPNIQLKLLYANVLKIFLESKYYDIIGKQDVIYILGLTEYLPERIFQRLTRFLFELLNDNGKLVITYKDESIVFPSLPPEWFCNWNFIKRSKEDLINTAKQIGAGQYSLKIEREGTESIFFFILTKN